MTKTTKKNSRTSTQPSRTSTGFTAEEQAAMKERARELKAEAKASTGKLAGEKDLLAKIAEMPQQERALASRLHEIITATAPDLSPKTWYGMPAYARDGKIVCFIQSAAKFKTRYSTLGFSDEARLDDGAMWPTAFAVTTLSTAEETRIIELVKKAIR